MPEERYRDIKKTTIGDDMPGLAAKTFYRNKYFALWMSSRRFPELTRGQNRFLLKRLWENGSVAAFIIPETKPDPTMAELLTNASSKTLIAENISQPNGVLGLADYATTQYNVTDEPSVVNLINRRGATFFPTAPQVVNKDVVIIYAHESRKAVSALVNFYIDRIVDVEMTIDVNLFTHKLPRLVAIDPADEARVKNIVEAIDRGEKKLFLSVDDINAIKNVLEGSGNAYIIDKLHQYKPNLENELLTFFGINNTPHEKAERLVTGEVDSNNQLIYQCGDCFKDPIDESCEDVTNYLGFKLTQEVKEPEEPEETGKPKEGGEDDNE